MKTYHHLPSVNNDKSSLTDNVLSAGNDPSKSMEVLINSNNVIVYF